LDYEIYGNGTGSLQELVYEPAERLREIFLKWNARFVNFVEVAEFQKIEEYASDEAIGLVTRQIRELHQSGFEIGLHLHPQWCNARYENGRWWLDASEYNLSTLDRPRIVEIVHSSLDFLRRLVGNKDFTPISFRAGNWLFQPTETVACVLAEHGIRIDSSVFKGGVQHAYHLDYRRALRNGYHWSFKRDVNEPDLAGPWIEVPIYTEMVPAWRMATAKRIKFRGAPPVAGQNGFRRLNRLRDLLRLRYPLKLDFCRMTLAEATAMMENILCDDYKQPELYRPIVAIGHSKDLADPQTIDAFLEFLKEKEIAITTFESAYPKLVAATSQTIELTLPS
jgi:hypothetical protein